METIESTSLLKLKAFIGDMKVKNIEELFGSSECGVFVVAGFFVSVVEGVDMWVPTLSVNSMPRFRMKVEVRHGDKEAVFSLFDSDVESLAVETCSLLRSMGESCSTFPYEMESYYGDVILYKVEKHYFEEAGENPNFKVISICNDVSIVNKFIGEYLPHISNIFPMEFLAQSYQALPCITVTNFEAKKDIARSFCGFFDYFGCGNWH